MYQHLLTAALKGMDGCPVQVEADISQGLPSFQLTGLAGGAIRESWLRVRAAVLNSGQRLPARKVTVNLSPADLPKEGSHFDLPIALGVLGAAGLFDDIHDPAGVFADTAFFGELTLDGRLKGVRGLLPLVLGMQQAGCRRVVIPKDNLSEMALVKGMAISPCEDLTEVLREIGDGFPHALPSEQIPRPSFAAPDLPDFDDVLGQAPVKRALVIAAAGGHGILLTGSPGSGKSLLARRMASILPPMDYEEQLATTKIWSVAGILREDRPLVDERPFRSPHHSITRAALLGGGKIPRPGEVSLAHNGVLFLDELAEFSPQVLDGLREPLEENRITVARSGGAVTFPAKVIFVGAMNPCKCGNFGDPVRRCTCSAEEVRRYQSRLSGPLMDRIDVHVQVSSIMYKADEKDYGDSSTLSAQEMRDMVARARVRQMRRFLGSGLDLNARIPPARLAEYCPLPPALRFFLEEAAARLSLSMRSVHKVIRLSRTIADVEDSEKIREEHLAEALSYRKKEVLP